MAYVTPDEYWNGRRRVSYSPAIVAGELEPFINRQAYRSPAPQSGLPMWYQGEATTSIPAAEYRPPAFFEQPRVTYRYVSYNEPQLPRRGPTTRGVQDDKGNILPRYVTERCPRPEHKLPPFEIPPPVGVSNFEPGTPTESPPITYWEQPAVARRHSNSTNAGNVGRDGQCRRSSASPAVCQTKTPTPQVRLPPRIPSVPDYQPPRPQIQPVLPPPNRLRDSPNGPRLPPFDESQIPTVPVLSLPPSGFVNNDRLQVRGRVVTMADASTSVMKAPDVRKPARVDNGAQTSVIRSPIPVQVHTDDDESSRPSSSQTVLAGSALSEEDGGPLEVSKTACGGLCCC